MARSKKSKGLGDTIGAITEATGIKKVVEVFSEVTGVDCGCDARKEKLNKLFPYNRNVNCLNEADYKALGVILKQNELTPEDQKTLSDIYFNVFKHRLQLSNCSSCWKGKIEELKKVYNEYKLDEI
jgi:hypothetical protein